MILKKNKFLNDAKNIEKISEGYSEAWKYSFEKDEKKYFLKIGKFEINKNLEDILSDSKISHPKIIEIDKFDDKCNYIIEEYNDGKNLKYQLDKYDNKYIYEYGFKIGSEYRNLRKKYPDIKMTYEKYIEYLSMVKERINKSKRLLKYNNDNLDKVIINFLDNSIYYLEKNSDSIKNSSLVFGHTDIKPSNYLIVGKNIVATDVEHTGYKELSLSMLWSYARGDFNDEKNFSFAKGYINALYSFDIPDNVLKCFDYSYLFNILGICIKYIENNELDKLLKLIKYINKNYIVNNKLVISNKLKSIIDLSKTDILINSSINIMDGSYSPNNLTFKCTTKNNTYFLKVLERSNNEFDDIIYFYNILDKYHIPSAPIIKAGCFVNNKFYYIISKFINSKEIDKVIDNTFYQGFKIGKLVASYFKRIKNETIQIDKVYDKNSLYKDMISNVKSIYSRDECFKYMPWNEKDAINYIKKYIISFNNEKINLIHGDIKFGNILYNNDNICFIDNESFKYSYDVMNFIYNIHLGFSSEDNECYKGFINGYLNYMNNGEIPYRVQNQAKLLFIYYILRSVGRIIDKKNDYAKMEMYIDSLKKYIDEDNDIEWLR